MKTRSKPAAKASAKANGETPDSSSEPTQTLPRTVENPPKAFILPKPASSEARIVTLTNPATSVPNRYYFCPEKGFYEFTKIAASKSAPRSWLFAPEKNGTVSTENKAAINTPHETGAERTGSAAAVNPDASPAFSDGFITKNADLFVATPLDAVFLLLPALWPSKSSKSSQKQMFLSLDDHLDAIGESSAHLKHLIRNAQCQELIENRLQAVCDTVDAGDEKMYRLSKEKLLQELLAKSKRLGSRELPASLEERFVRRELEAPIMGIKREETSTTVSTGEHEENGQVGTAESQTPSEAADSQFSADSAASESTAATSITSSSTTVIESKTENSVPAGVVELLRIRTTFNFMATSYLAPHARNEMQNMLSSQEVINFAPLDKHLQHIAELRAEAQALHSLSDNISRKRTAEDDEATEARAEKKRKKEEEEKKKKLQSRGLKELAKVNTSGMKKLSAFFAKAPAKR